MKRLAVISSQDRRRALAEVHAEPEGRTLGPALRASRPAPKTYTPSAQYRFRRDVPFLIISSAWAAASSVTTGTQLLVRHHAR